MARLDVSDTVFNWLIDYFRGHEGNGLLQVRTQKPLFLPLKNDSKYHERRKYEEIIWWKPEIFTLHKVLIRHVRSLAFALIDTR